MTERFTTNRTTLLFYGALSIVVVPYGVMNLIAYFNGVGTRRSDSGPWPLQSCPC